MKKEIEENMEETKKAKMIDAVSRTCLWHRVVNESRASELKAASRPPDGLTRVLENLARTMEVGE